MNPGHMIFKRMQRLQGGEKDVRYAMGTSNVGFNIFRGKQMLRNKKL